MSDMGEEQPRLDGKHTVLTPEYVEFDFVLAGLMSRTLALLIDSAISILGTGVILIGLFLLTGLGAASLGADFGGQLLKLSLAAQFIIWFLVDWGYMVFFEIVWNGQTIGKRALGLRVIQDSGVRIGAQQALLRNLLRPLDKLPAFYLVGAASALLTGTHQRLGDVVAGTIVVRERRLKIPAGLQRPDDELKLLTDATFVERIGKLRADEEAVLFSAAIRREELAMEARLNLFSTLAKHIEEELGITKPPHLSDEKLILLVTAAIAGRRGLRKGK